MKKVLFIFVFFYNVLFFSTNAYAILFYFKKNENIEYIKNDTFIDDTTTLGNALDGYKFFKKTTWKEYKDKQKR